MLEGTVVNGVIVFDAPATLPEGARVRIEVTEEEGDFAPPPATETYAEHLAALRESIASAAAGERGKSVAEVFDAIEQELSRPTKSEG